MKRLVSLALLLGTLTAVLTAQEISPYLFGQNHWIADGDENGRVGYLDQLWPQIEESGVTMIRIGGNNYQGRLPERTRLTQMIDSIRGIGAEPLLQIPRHYSATQTKELVEYFTGGEEKRVNYWSIGNEPMLRGEMTIEEVHAYLTRIAPAIKQVDPTAKTLVYDECELRRKVYQAFCGGELDLTGLKENGVWLIDGFTFHNYPNGREFERDDVIFSGPESIRRQCVDLLEMMKAANEKHGRTGEGKLLWGLTEVNVTYANPNREISGYGNPSFVGGQFIAEMYGLGMEYGALTVTPWCISETDRVRTDFGYIGLPTEFYPRSSYYHTQMMAETMEGEFVLSSDNQDYVKVIASRNDEQIAVLVMNQHKEEDFDFDLVLDSEAESSSMLCVRVDADSEGGFSGTLPNQTTMLFVFGPEGSLVRQSVYGLQQNLAHRAPEVLESTNQARIDNR